MEATLQLHALIYAPQANILLVDQLSVHLLAQVSTRITACGIVTFDPYVLIL